MQKIVTKEILESYLGSKFNKLSLKTQKILTRTIDKILKIREINSVLERNYHLKNFDFINQFFEDINFSYIIKSNQRANIPSTGRLFIISNHPLGGIDGMALLAAIS